MEVYVVDVTLDNSVIDCCVECDSVRREGRSGSVMVMGFVEVVGVVFVGVGLVVRMSLFISRTMTIFHKEFSKRSSWQVGSERHEVAVAKLGT